MLSSSGFRDGLGERDLQFERESGEVRERLFLRPELAAYETALRRRIGRLASMADPRLVPVQGLEHDRATGRLTVVSRHLSGTRLSDTLRASRERESIPDLTIGLFLAAEILAAAHTFHSLSGLPHGALTPNRVIVTADADVVLADYAYAEVIEAARFTPQRLWDEFGIAHSLGAPFSFAGDIRQTALIAIALMLGRPLDGLDVWSGIDAHLAEVEDVALIRGGRLFADPVIGWLRRALGRGHESAFAASDEAADACYALLTDRERAMARPAFLQFLLELETATESILSDFSVPPGVTPVAVIEASGESEPTPVLDAVTARVPETEPAPGPEPEPEQEQEPEPVAYRPAPLRLVERPAVQEPDLETEPEPERPAFVAWHFEPVPVEEPAPTAAPEPIAALEETPAPEEAPAVTYVEPEPIRVEAEPEPAVEETPDPFTWRPFSERFAPEPEPEPGAVPPVWAPEPVSFASDPVSFAPEPVSFTSEPEPVAPSGPAFEPYPSPEPGSQAFAYEPVDSLAPMVEHSLGPTPQPALEDRESRPVPEPELPRVAPIEREEPAAALHGAEFQELNIQPAASASDDTVTRVSSQSPFALLEKYKKRARIILHRDTEPVEPPVVSEVVPPPTIVAPPISTRIPPPAVSLKPPAPALTRPAESPLASPAIRLKGASAQRSASATFAPPRGLSERPVPIFEHEQEEERTGFKIPWKLAAAAVVVLVTGLAATNMKWSGSTPAAAVAPGTLVVETNPPGSDVFIDGERKGVTPTVVQVAPGRHEMKLARKGAEHAYSIDVASGARRVERLDWTALRQTGGIEVISNQPGSKVLVDGKARGETPLVLGDLAPGRHLVVVQGPNGNVRRRVTVVAGETTKLDLAIYSGWVIVTAPIELKIFENGKAIGTAGEGPVMLSAGPHTIELVNELLSYRSTHIFEMGPGEEKRLNITPTGRMNINAVPWAEVFVDGERIGETPLANVAVPLGARELLFKHPEHGERRMPITVTGGQPVQISIDLTRPDSP